jgi:hypothetical protein
VVEQRCVALTAEQGLMQMDKIVGMDLLREDGSETLRAEALFSDRSSRRRWMKVPHKPRPLLVCQRRSAPCMSIMFALIYERSTMMTADHKRLV